MWRICGIGLLLLVLVEMTTGCQLSQPAFTRTAGNAGSAFAAAATTLSYAHEGKITYAYASSSFVNYQSELDGLDQTLPSLQGAPVDILPVPRRAGDSPPHEGGFLLQRKLHERLSPRHVLHCLHRQKPQALRPKCFVQR